MEKYQISKSTLFRVGRPKDINLEFCKHSNFILTSKSAKTLGITIFGEKVFWTTHYTLAFKLSSETALRSFQYKSLNIIIPTNDILYTYNYKSSSLCEFCSIYMETIENLFW